MAIYASWALLVGTAVLGLLHIREFTQTKKSLALLTAICWLLVALVTGLTLTVK